MRDELIKLIQEVKFDSNSSCKSLNDNYCHAAKIADHLLKNKTIVLPCEPGTIVYEIYKFCGDGTWEIEEHKFKLEDLDKIGKTIFLDEKNAKLTINKLEALQLIVDGKDLINGTK